MQKRRWLRTVGYGALGVFLFILFIAFTMPASWLAMAAERFSSGLIRMEAPSGTVWSGQAQLDIGSQASGVRRLGKIQWRLSPWWLFAGRARLSVHLDGVMRASALLNVARGKYSAQNLSATFPVQLVSLAYAPAAFFEPSGTIELQAEELTLTRAGLTGEANATWRGAGGKFTQGALGDYKITIGGTGGAASIQLSTISGRLQLGGQGSWDIPGDGTLQFNGNAIPTGDVATLEPLLRPIGPNLGNGRRALRFSTRVSPQLLGL